MRTPAAPFNPFVCPAVFENSSKIVIVMEYASRGDLYDYISERQRLSEHEARHFFRQVVSAVYYCHKVGWHPHSRGFPGEFLAGERLGGLPSAHPDDFPVRERLDGLLSAHPDDFV